MNAVDTPRRDTEIDRLRAELSEWRRRAEIAEAVAVERLARAETAEKALEAARSALRVGEPAAASPAPPKPGAGPQDAGEPALPLAGRSLRERWRRYIDSVN